MKQIQYYYKSIEVSKNYIIKCMDGSKTSQTSSKYKCQYELPTYIYIVATQKYLNTIFIFERSILLHTQYIP